MRLPHYLKSGLMRTGNRRTKHLLHSRSPTGVAISKTAFYDQTKICWWCGGRPHDNKWHADHLCPELADSPLVAACRRCNQSRQHVVPQPSAVRRLFHSPDIVCSMGLSALRQYLLSSAERVLGHPHLFETLIAAQRGKGYVRTYGKNAKLTIDEARTRQALQARLM